MFMVGHPFSKSTFGVNKDRGDGTINGVNVYNIFFIMMLSLKVSFLFQEYLFFIVGVSSLSMSKMKMREILSKEARGDGRKSGRKGRKGLIRAAHGHQDEDHFVKDFLISIFAEDGGL